MSHGLLDCQVCGTPIPRGHKRVACSRECKKVYKSAYDKARYIAEPAIRQAAIDRACKWQRDNLSRKVDYDAAYRESTREHRLESKRKYYREHPPLPIMGTLAAHRRRAQKERNGVFLVSPNDLAGILRRQDNRCAYCRVRLDESNPLEWDHVVPLARGGQHSVGNLTPACRGCNRSKHARTITEWRAGVVVRNRPLV